MLISLAQRRQMEQHVTECVPEEACGLLGGQSGRVEMVLPVENVLHSPIRFRMEPRDQIRAMNEIEQRGYELVAIYHSHPSGPDVLSATDLAELAYAESLYLLWYPATAGWACRAFDVSSGLPEEVPLRLR